MLLMTAVAACAVLLSAQAPASALELPAIYGSHMMLQQGIPNLLWGWADSGATVTVHVRDTKLKATADSDGVWNVTMPAGSEDLDAIDIDITDGSHSITLEDVLYGDVYVCSGQSNMQISVSGSLNATAEINAANYPDMRIFQVALENSYANTTTPQVNLTASIPWTSVTPQVIGPFSGHCYFFARQLHTGQAASQNSQQRSQSQPQHKRIGLIQSCWGGTAIQVWMRPDALKKCGQSRAVEESFDQATRFYGERSTYTQHTRATSALGGPTKASCLYNSMIAPLTRLQIKGAVWDQGEANAGQPQLYPCLLSSMITDWRQQWAVNTQASILHQPSNTANDWPFVFRQLHAYPSGGQLGTMRLTMAGALNTTNTGMAISYDLGCMNSSDGNIHFMNKEEIGRRSAVAMRTLAYKEPTDYPGPIATKAVVVSPGSGGLKMFCAHISFVNVDDNNPINLLNGQPPYHGIELESGAGPGAWDDNTNWLPVVASVVNSSAIAINVTLDGSEATKNPLSVRYAYWDYPPLGITDSNNSPAWPFLLPFQY